jgi:hypothetical protein
MKLVFSFKKAKCSPHILLEEKDVKKGELNFLWGKENSFFEGV